MSMAPRSSPTRWLLIVAVAALSAACNRRDGMNFSCQWVDAAPFPLDLGSESHVQHLMDDINETAVSVLNLVVANRDKLKV